MTERVEARLAPEIAALLELLVGLICQVLLDLELLLNIFQKHCEMEEIYGLMLQGRFWLANFSGVADMAGARVLRDAIVHIPRILSTQLPYCF